MKSTSCLWQIIGPDQRIGLKTFVPCRCKCGIERLVAKGDLANGRSTNCGCVRRAKVAARNYKHGLADTRLHVAWMGMIARCENPNHKAYKRYGGRGIKVCERWRESFTAFLEDMGEPPTPKHKIDRKDNDGDYEPSNCLWATNKENCRHTRQSRILELDGVRLCMSEWAERTGIPVGTISQRLNKYGWSVHRALTTPVYVKFRRAKA